MDHAAPRDLTLAKTAVVAIDMGYGHLRPARSIARLLDVPMLHADRSPLADPDEQRRWAAMRRFYETATRVSGLPYFGTPIRALLNAITDIPPLYPFRDLSQPTLALSLLERSARNGLGRSMVAYLEERDQSLLTTFYSPASFADYHGYKKVFCVVTDSDVNRVWAPINPESSTIVYLAPSGRVVRRLLSYGVARERIELTGFPLPDSLVGGAGSATLRKNLASRLSRLDPKLVFRQQYAADLEALDFDAGASGPPHLVFAVGGTGAQSELPGLFLPSLRPLLGSGQLRLTLVAGVRREVSELFLTQLSQSGLEREIGRSVNILHEPDLDRYFARFDTLLSDTDVLWTKPSELVFYSGLGIPLLLAPPIGIHESYNLRWAREHGAGLKQRNPRVTGERIVELLNDGHLAACAWAGFRRAPHQGLYRIVERLSR